MSQVHVGCPSEGASHLPKGVEIHLPIDGEPDPDPEEIEEPFLKVGQGSVLERYQANNLPQAFLMQCMFSSFGMFLLCVFSFWCIYVLPWPPAGRGATNQLIDF